MRRHKILAVDDEILNLKALERLLGVDYDILKADSGAAALKILGEETVSLIISDQRMPHMTGMQLLEQSLTNCPDAIKILSTAYTDADVLIDAINAGLLYKYISKPWDPEDLKLTIRRALEAYELKENNDRLLVELSEALKELESVSVGTIRSLVGALDAKCDYTAGHSLRVSRIAVLIGRQLGLPNDQLRDLELGGTLHDIGKIGVPESILWKQDRLTPEEATIMARHPVTSAEIIGDFKGLSRVREYVKHHHESWDGTGYPDGLAGEDIPIGARIIHVSDAYDAMNTDRPYRRALGHTCAAAELEKSKGKQSDPDVVDAFLALSGVDGRELDRNLAEGLHDSFIGFTLPSVNPKDPA